MEILPGASDGPTRLYCAGENAVDEIPQEEMDVFAAKVGSPLPEMLQGMPYLMLCYMYTSVDVPLCSPCLSAHLVDVLISNALTQPCLYSCLST